MEEFSKTYSFIIPHKNSPELLNRCLDSIPQRDDIQIIVVDDNSEDNKKPKVLRDDVEIVYVDAKETKGAGHARNVGIAHAKGKWLLFPDCDDEYNKGFILTLDKYKNLSINVLYFNSKYIDAKTCTELPKIGFQAWFELHSENQYPDDYLKFKNNVPWNKMVSHEFVRSNSLRFEECPNGNDIWFSFQVGWFSRLSLADKEKLYNYYKHPNSIVNQKNQSVDKKICKLIHGLQKNAFYSKLGHFDWKVSFVKLMYNEFRKDSLKAKLILFWNILINIRSFVSKRKKWCEILS